jgi:pilus assembly protein CpaB
MAVNVRIIPATPKRHSAQNNNLTAKRRVAADYTTTTMLLLQDIEILSVGTKVAANNSGGINTLTLAVTPEQAQPLILAGEKGVIRLLLRSPVDESQYSLPGYTLKRLTQP